MGYQHLIRRTLPILSTYASFHTVTHNTSRLNELASLSESFQQPIQHQLGISARRQFGLAGSAPDARAVSFVSFNVDCAVTPGLAPEPAASTGGLPIA
jgi:hypothetical protein